MQKMNRLRQITLLKRYTVDVRSHPSLGTQAVRLITVPAGLAGVKVAL